MDLWSSAETLMFMSLSMVLNWTVAPASRHTRAKLLSVGQALVRSLPDLPQAALCLPSVSKGAPHSHRASTTCSGRRSRSNTKVRKSCGQTTNSGPVGAPMSTSLEPGPEWEHKWAWSAAHDWRKTMVSRNGVRKWKTHGIASRVATRPVHCANRGVGALRPSMLPNWAVPQNHNGQGFELPLAVHPRIRRAPPSQVAARHGSQLGRDVQRSWASRRPTKPRKQTEPSWTQISDPNRPSAWANSRVCGPLSSGWDLLAIHPTRPPSSSACPCRALLHTRPKHWEEGFATDGGIWDPRIAEEFAMHTAGRALTGSPPTSDSLLPTVSG